MKREHATVLLLAMVTGVLGGVAGWFAAHNMQPLQKDGADVLATIEQVRARPREFAGKEIRLTGQLNECYHWECSLCPEAMTSTDRNADRCLALSFRPLVDGTGFGSDEQESVFRFSSVILTATFDPACWEEGVCLDRQVVLKDASVVSVIKRRPGVAGLWKSDTSTLTEIGGVRAGELRSAAIRAGYPENPPIKAFATDQPDPKIVVCWSPMGIDEQEPGAWPTTLESALYAKSTLDFFECNEVRKVEGQLVIQARA